MLTGNKETKLITAHEYIELSVRASGNKGPSVDDTNLISKEDLRIGSSGRIKLVEAFPGIVPFLLNTCQIVMRPLYRSKTA